MEIERKFLVTRLPDALEQYPHERMEQAYVSVDPLIRIRRAGKRYILTCKGRGLLSREEFETEMTPEAYGRLLSKADGLRIVKERYKIPLGAYTVELDIFAPPLAPLVFAEVEFPTEDAAQAFAPPDWFGRDVTFDPAYTNAALSRDSVPEDVWTPPQPRIIDSGRTGECAWKLDSNQALTISGQGKMENYCPDDELANTSYTPYWKYRENVKVAIIERGVTLIGDSTFDGCISLKSVTIPDSVTSIGNFAFYRCAALTNVLIPKSVISIGDWAFVGCSSLTSATIPDSVTSIGNSAFRLCSNLKSVTISDNVTSIGNSAFWNSGLTSVRISDSVTSIRYFTFCGCSNLTSVTIPNSVTAIEHSAFRDCPHLTNVTIPDSVTSIGEYAFKNCNNLKQVIVSKETKIDPGAFDPHTQVIRR